MILARPSDFHRHPIVPTGMIVVREGRLELPLCRQSWILSPVRLPIPPLSHIFIGRHLFLNKTIVDGAAGSLRFHTRQSDLADALHNLTISANKLNSAEKFNRKN